MARTTRTDVRQVWANYLETCSAAGFDVSGWTLAMGSPNAGTLYTGRTAENKPVPGAWANGWEAAYLGSTAAETYAALQHAMAAVKAVTALRTSV